MLSKLLKSQWNSHCVVKIAIATWKIVIESVQSLRMDNYRVAFTRFLAFYADNPSGLCDGETPAKWQSKASFATHPSTETEWRTKLLARFSS